MKKSVSTTPKRGMAPEKVALVIALAAGIWLLKDYFSLILIAVIMAYLMSPIYKWLQKRLKRDATAAAVTLLISILLVVIPAAIIIAITILQASTMINHLSSSLNNQNLGQLSTQFVDWISQTVSRVTNDRVTVTNQEVWNQLSKVAIEVANFVLDTLKSWVGGLGGFITAVILYMYIFTGLLVYQEKLVELVKRLNPLGGDVTDLYLTKAGGMTKAMIRGQFIIAIIQGAESALILHLAGLPYGVFFLLVLTFLSIIPLGAGIVTIPIGVVNLLIGNYWQGTLILLNHFIVVTNIDNVLKPILVPKSVRLHPALLLLSVFAGLGLFGFIGIILGPVIMILITTTIQTYLASIEPKNKTAR